ncbi:MAG: nitroreductase family protein [Candidatus Heimdallarchaeota archaeon]|nr:nitroreductase family protein [Candidatus Heimdallarchaeota archaeon]
MNETIKVIQNLRTIRKFSDKKISTKDLETIIKSSVRAANSSKRQNYSIIVVDEKEILDQMFYGSNIGLIFCLDFNRLIDTAKHLGYNYDPKNIRLFITGFIDTCLAAQTATIAAKSLGIDSIFTNSVHRAKIEDVYKFFNLPEQYCFPVIALGLGYPEEEPEWKMGRISGSGIIHKNKYKKLSTEELDQLVKDYENQDLRLGVSAEKLSELGFERYLDWFFEVRSRPFPEEKINELYDILRKAKFLVDK